MELLLMIGFGLVILGVWQIKGELQTIAGKLSSLYIPDIPLDTIESTLSDIESNTDTTDIRSALEDIEHKLKNIADSLENIAVSLDEINTNTTRDS